jgi:hypothetical protein
MTVHTLRSRNVHVDCHLFPCPRCRAKRDAEQAAKHRHPAGSDLPAPVVSEIDWADHLVRFWTADGQHHVELGEDELQEALNKLQNPTPCSRDNCWAPAESGGLCAAHDELEA